MVQQRGSRRQQAVATLKKRRIALLTKMLEGPDRNDPVHRLVEFLPALEPHFDLFAQRRQPPAGVFGLGLTERESDGTHAELLDGPLQRRSPAAADLEQSLPR